MTQVCIWGNGVVGKATGDAFEKLGAKVVRYDKYQKANNDCYVVKDCPIVFICVPTATNKTTGEQDLTPLEETFSILRGLNYTGTIVVKSTVLPGTTRNMARLFKFSRVCHNPEFLTAARPFEDFMEQKTVLIGGVDQFATLQVAEFYKDCGFSDIQVFNKPEYTETIKYMRNNFLATKVAFLNEQYEICKRSDVQYDRVIAGMLSLGGIEKTHTLVPGPDNELGFGGMCLVKDTLAQLTWAKKLGLEAEILQNVVDQNKRIRPQEYQDETA